MSTNPVIPGCGFHHAAVQTTDYEGTKRFYTEVLGCQPVNEWQAADGRRLALLDLGDGGYIEVVGVTAIESGPARQAPMIHLALRTTDVDAAVARARSAGCTVTIEPKDVSLGAMPVRVGFIVGPNGEVLEFFQEK